MLHVPPVLLRIFTVMISWAMPRSVTLCCGVRCYRVSAIQSAKHTWTNPFKRKTKHLVWAGPRPLLFRKPPCGPLLVDTFFHLGADLDQSIALICNPQHHFASIISCFRVWFSFQINSQIFMAKQPLVLCVTSSQKIWYYTVNGFLYPLASKLLHVFLNMQIKWPFLIGFLSSGVCLGHRALWSKWTHLARFIQRDADRQERDEKDTGGIIIVVIAHPQGDAEHLKDIKWIEDLKRKEERDKEERKP